MLSGLFSGLTLGLMGLDAARLNAIDHARHSIVCFGEMAAGNCRSQQSVG